MRYLPAILLSIAGICPAATAETPDLDHPFHVCGQPDTTKEGPCATAPRPVSFTEPDYTDRARKAKLQGRILLEVVVDREGNVAKTKIVQGLGMGLDENSVKTVRKWKFKPGTYDGKPVPVTLPVEVTFRLR